jgi:hypothetical protein
MLARHTSASGPDMWKNSRLILAFFLSAVKLRLTTMARASSTRPRAMPMENSPLPVSRAMAVVMVRVCHLMLPPTIMEMPTSLTTRP